MVEGSRARVRPGNEALDEITGQPGFYCLKAPARWEGLAQQMLTVGTKTDRVELVFDPWPRATVINQ